LNDALHVFEMECGGEGMYIVVVEMMMVTMMMMMMMMLLLLLMWLLIMMMMMMVVVVVLMMAMTMRTYTYFLKILRAAGVAGQVHEGGGRGGVTERCMGGRGGR